MKSEKLIAAFIALILAGYLADKATHAFSRPAQPPAVVQGR